MRGAVWNRRKDGSVYVQNLAVTCAPDGRGAPCHYVGVYTDPQFDPIPSNASGWTPSTTPSPDIPNRILLQDRLESSLLRARRDAKVLALLFLDLDGFNPVNDTHGHAVGDAVLRDPG